MLAALVAAAAFRSQAAVTVSPAAPTSNDFIMTTVDVFSNCDTTDETLIDGNTLRTTIMYVACSPGPSFPAPVTFTFGPVPAGTYVYEVYVGFAAAPPPELVSQQPLVVSSAPAAAAVPVLSDIATALLIGVMSLAAIAALRRVV